jgi:hypothetical protein
MLLRALPCMDALRACVGVRLRAREVRVHRTRGSGLGSAYTVSYPPARPKRRELSHSLAVLFVRIGAISVPCPCRIGGTAPSGTARPPRSARRASRPPRPPTVTNALDSPSPRRTVTCNPGRASSRAQASEASAGNAEPTGHALLCAARRCSGSAPTHAVRQRHRAVGRYGATAQCAAGHSPSWAAARRRMIDHLSSCNRSIAAAALKPHLRRH